MDNITHSLIGCVIGEAFYQHQSSTKRSKNSRAFCWGFSVLANNFPDLDFLYAPLTNGRLGYLLHHRGHTHTIGGIVLQTALILLAIFGIAKLKKIKRFDYAACWPILLVGLFAHVAMDALNVYGVHPFWPFSNQWIYGDALFIVEPWLWVLLFSFLVFAKVPVWLRGIFGAGLVMSLGLVWGSGFVPQPFPPLLTLAALGSLWLSRRLNDRQRIKACFAGVFTVIAIFFGLSKIAKADLNSRLTSLFPDAKRYDVILSPLPANPTCFALISIETEKDLYIGRKGIYSFFPSWIKTGKCGDRMSSGRAATLLPVRASADDHIRWTGEYEAPLPEFKLLSENHCGFHAVLQFVRAPFWENRPEGLMTGDLRFDRGRGGFSQIQFTENSCPRFLPPWIAPRSDILMTLSTGATPN